LFSVRGSTFRMAIGDVLFGCAYGQMCGPNTRRVIASVK
jgi:hypothetical protein